MFTDFKDDVLTAIIIFLDRFRTPIDPRMNPAPEGLDTYSPYPPFQDQPTIISIVVPSEYDKEQLLLASKYIHDFRDLDTGFMAVNTIAHLYHCPDLIVVQR